MAHALRYYKEIQQDNGQTIRLEIHKKDSTLPAVEIGRVLQALHLDIQGGADTIDAPIVKTSLTMTFVDAPDLEAGKKCGNWEEFYTPDSTMWKVVLKADGKTIWGGYVTPDSYQEDLRYRGSVTIIARDNIGHMQDFPFDMEGNAEGMVALQELVNEAWAKIESPMSLDWRHEGDDADYLLCDGVEAPQTYLNVSAFEDMNYFDAVEKALYSYGLVMRYTGLNRVRIMSLRDLPYQGKSGAPRAIEPTFIAHAQRELAPAVRRIEESVKYDIEESVALPRIKENDFSGSSGTYRCAIEGVDLGYGKFGTLEHEAPIWPIINTPHWSNIPSTSLSFNPKIYPIGYFSEQQGLTEDIYQPMYLAANNVDDRYITFSHLITCAAFNLRIKFTDPISLNSSNKIERCTTFNLKSIKYAIFIEQDQTTYYYGKDGGWRIDYQELTEEYDATQPSYDFVKTINMGEFSGSTEIQFVILKIEYAQTSSGLNKYGLYAGIQLLAFEQSEGNAVLETNNVNTKYVDSNNVIIERDPEFGPAYNTVALPQIIKNGIFVKSGNAYLPAKGWAWSGSTPQQMAVYNHLQLLCYHSKPNNVISGDIVNADFVNMEAIYKWGGANHLLVSGSYNFLNGRIESAVLREFKFYNEMWSDVSGTSLPDTEQNNRTTAESGSGAAKASTYSNETTVNIGGSGGGGTGGSTTLAGLLDVQVSSPSNGQALVYDSASGMWMNKTIEKGDKVTSSAIISALGFTPFDAAAFTKANIQSVLGISDWALGASMPLASSSARGGIKIGFSAKYQNGSYYSIPVELDSEKAFVKLTKTMVSTALGFTPVSSADIEVTKAKVISALGYTPMNQADFTGDNIVLKLGYTPFDSDAFTKSNIKNALGIADWALAASKPSYTWTEIGSRPTALSAFTNDLGLGSLAYKSSLVASDIPSLSWSKITSGKPTTLSGYGITDAYTKTTADAKFLQQAGGTITGDVIINTKLTSTVIEALQYFADGKLIMHRNAGAENLYFNYGGAAEAMSLYGSMYGFHIGASRERAFTIDENKDASFAANLTVVGNMYSKNYPAGKALSQDPTSAFISTIFDADAVSDSSYRMKILRSGLAYDRFNAAYSPILTIKASDTHGFISFGYNSANKGKCYIGAGIGDAVSWSGALFHDNMDLTPKDDGVFYLGYSDKRWRTLNAVNVSANGLFGYVPNGGTYQQYRVFYEGDKLYIQAGSQDGLSTVGKLVICGIYSATLADFTIYSQQTLFSGAVQVNGTSRFVSLATFDKGLKIGDATLTWDASAGMLKIDKGIYSDGAITAGKKS